MMIKRSFIILFFLFFVGQGFAWAAIMPVDSIGMEKRNGRNYVVHKVVPKETLFALSRKYQVPVDQIVDANPRIQSGLQVGQLVYVPRKVAVAANPVVATTAPAAERAAPRTFVVDDKGNKLHQVAEKQTLYSISRLYGVTVADIKRWNQLSSDQVSLGSQLIVGVGNKPTSSPQYSQEPDDDVEKVREAPARAEAPTPKKTEAPVAKAEPAAPEKTESRSTEKETEPFSKITETGLAEVIENRSENNKYLALHKSAPVGTILQVKNSMNGQSVYVRVIGKLPETGVNDKVIIRISNRAYQKLAPQDSRFRVEVSYMP